MAALAALGAADGGHVLSNAVVTEGDLIAVRYQARGAPLWHERLVLLLLPNHSFTGVTPDGDCYEEDLLPGGDVDALTPLANGVSGGGSPAIGGQRVYGFRALPLLHQLVADRAAAASRLNVVPSPVFAVNVGRRGCAENARRPVARSACLGPTHSSLVLPFYFPERAHPHGPSCPLASGGGPD
ncbi:unnamed protein product [Prorocentrum cordatum]|uniref:Uncharacterized protein n=1 Tax=Prorocentrum cordatum TaxID=2364126 RepID=A0ABN9TTD0_9DINO|nr:unnamed protein product [Polarella glacialis]